MQVATGLKFSGTGHRNTSGAVEHIYCICAQECILAAKAQLNVFSPQVATDPAMAGADGQVALAARGGDYLDMTNIEYDEDQVCRRMPQCISRLNC